MNEPIYSVICPINELAAKIEALWKEKYYLSHEQAEALIDKTIQPYVRELRDNLYAIVEYPYIDKMYRDTFYHYYSSKLELPPRDSIRISLFDSEVKDENFLDAEHSKDLINRNAYLGFITLR